MGSSWRRNWWEFGCGYGTDITAPLWPDVVLCAQVAGDPSRFLTSVGASGGILAARAIVPVGTGYCVGFDTVVRRGRPPHFPYGYDVLPDVHG